MKPPSSLFFSFDLWKESGGKACGKRIGKGMIQPTTIYLYFYCFLWIGKKKFVVSVGCNFTSSLLTVNDTHTRVDPIGNRFSGFEWDL